MTCLVFSCLVAFVTLPYLHVFVFPHLSLLQRRHQRDLRQQLLPDMADPTDDSRFRFLDLPVEIQLKFLRQLIGFRDDYAPIACTQLLKGIRL